MVHYEYMALAKKTSVLREAMILLFEPRRFEKTHVNHIVPCRVCGHYLKQCLKTAIVSGYGQSPYEDSGFQKV